LDAPENVKKEKIIISDLEISKQIILYASQFAVALQHPLHSACSLLPTLQDYNQQQPTLKTIRSKAQSTLLTMGVKTPEIY
jgi:hypothetical protein